MNLTRLIEETGKRIRPGKPAGDGLTNAEIKEVLEIAIEVLKGTLIEEGRVEIQHFAVIEVRRIPVRSGTVQPAGRGAQRVIWLIRPAQALRRAVMAAK